METAGVHLLCELSECNGSLLADLAHVRQACEAAALDCGATIVAVNSHHFTPLGVSVLLFLAESHLSIHTWPEKGYAAVDIYTCGETASPRQVIAVLVSLLGAKVVDVREFLRGQSGGWVGYRSIEHLGPVPVGEAAGNAAPPGPVIHGAAVTPELSNPGSHTRASKPRY